MRISDWSSDVCSSDLLGQHRFQLGIQGLFGIHRGELAHRLRKLGAILLVSGRHRLALGVERRFGALAQIVRQPLPTEGLHIVGTQALRPMGRSEEHTSELQSLMRISYAVFCLKKKKKKTEHDIHISDTTMTHQ